MAKGDFDEEREGSSRVLLDGVVTLIMGLMIYLQWPSNAARAMGVFVGVSLVTSGLTRVDAFRAPASPAIEATNSKDCAIAKPVMLSE